MTKIRWLTLALTLSVFTSILLASMASASPQVKTYTVNSNGSGDDTNPGDGICHTAAGACSLRAAIQEANADGDVSTIQFDRKFQGTNDIDGCSLPTITADDTTIDASSQWDTADDRPGVELVGLGCTILSIQANSTRVLGLFFGGSDNGGVTVYGNLNIIGGYQTGQRNVFILGVYGVYVHSGDSNAISNNYIGTINGTSSVGSGTNGVGIHVQYGNYTTIADNLIVAQSYSGIRLNSGHNFVRNNIIGMSWNQSTALPNQYGIQLNFDDNTIGPGNVIAGNTSHGVYIYHADNLTISSNYIGSYTGVGNGGDGIHIHVSRNIHITEGNNIAYNAGNGIYAGHSAEITIQGNSVAGNMQVGIFYDTTTTGQIGGDSELQRNHIGGNTSHGIRLKISSAITVTGNYIGLGDGAFDNGNEGHGILIDSGSVDNYIGGTNPGEPNWIGWNHLDGVRLDGSATHHNYVVGNMIGAPINWGWEAPNHNHGIGVYNGAHNNWIGWDGLPNGGNIILANGWSGLAIVGSNENAVLANFIGTNGIRVNWGNAFYGITVSGSGNSIKGNEIAFNGWNGGLDGAQAGVLIDGAASVNNMISGNSTHDNDGPGIRLANGANHNLTAPTITSATCEQVEGTACANCLIEIYSDEADEGRRYEGYFTTTPAGSFTWNGAPFGPNITALAIGPGSATDTSPFSAPFHVGRCIPIRLFLPLVGK